MHTQARHARRSEAAVRDRVLRPAEASGLGKRGRRAPVGRLHRFPCGAHPFLLDSLAC